MATTPSSLFFLVRWCDCDELDLVPAIELNEKYSSTVLEFYEARSQIHKRFNRKRDLADSFVNSLCQEAVAAVDESVAVDSDAEVQEIIEEQPIIDLDEDAQEESQGTQDESQNTNDVSEAEQPPISETVEDAQVPPLPQDNPEQMEASEIQWDNNVDASSQQLQY